MARGDECKTASRANYACKSLDVTAPMQKPAYQAAKSYEPKKPEQKKDYGAWGSVFKDKKTFTEMHLC